MPDRPALETEIEITPKMVVAGVRALSTFKVSEDPLDWIVSEVYGAMRRCEAQAPLPLQVSDL